MVEEFVSNAYQAVIQTLIDLGVPFSQSSVEPSHLLLGSNPATDPPNPNGRSTYAFSLQQEPGHSAPRIFHVGNNTGRSVMDVLTQQVPLGAREGPSAVCVQSFCRHRQWSRKAVRSVPTLLLQPAAISFPRIAVTQLALVTAIVVDSSHVVTARSMWAPWGSGTGQPAVTTPLHEASGTITGRPVDRTAAIAACRVQARPRIRTAPSLLLRTVGRAGDEGGGGNLWRSRAPGPHAHGNTARQVVDGLRTEVGTAKTVKRTPHNPNTPTTGRR